MRRWLFILIFFSVTVCAADDESLGEEANQWSLNSYLKEPPIDWYFRALALSTWKDCHYPMLAEFEGFEHRYGGVALRPDFSWDSQYISAAVKPRWDIYTRQPIREGPRSSDQDLYIYEWNAELILFNQLSISYRRENKQWGPSYLLSPSNPFQMENGRNSPKSELDASEYTQLNWTPLDFLSIDLIANIDEGHREPLIGSFERTYAAKADWTGEQKQVSIITSVRDDEIRLGSYALWNLNEAWMLYGEAGWEEHDAEVLTGAGYTFPNGGIVRAEYFFNESGEKDKDEHPLFLLYQARQVSQREVLVRRNYLLLQYTQPMVYDVVDLTFRWIGGLDDESHAFFAFIDWGVTDRVELFCDATILSGELDEEFSSLFDYILQVGLELSF